LIGPMIRALEWDRQGTEENSLFTRKEIQSLPVRGTDLCFARDGGSPTRISAREQRLPTSFFVFFLTT